jgi:hypothetical protein
MVDGPGDQAAMMALATRLHEEAQAQKRKRRYIPMAQLSTPFTAFRGMWNQAFVTSLDMGQGTSWCIFDPQSTFIAWWDTFLIIGVIYSTAYTPLITVFRQAQWSHHEAADTTLDALFIFDMLIRMRTAFRDHGYDVTKPSTIAAHYLRGWFLCDMLSSFPVDRIVALVLPSDTTSVLGSATDRVAPISLTDVLALLRIFRIGRLVRKLSALTGANFLRVMSLMYLFTLFGHWLGLVWYTIAIRPIETSETYDSLAPWLWTLRDDGPYFVALRYVLMLTGHDAHPRTSLLPRTV